MSYFCWKAKAKFLICDHTTLCWQLLVSYLWEFTSDRTLVFDLVESMRKKKHLSLARKHLSKTGLRASSLKGNRTQLMRRSSYSSLKHGGLRRISSRSTFDINNVVIPSHVTSAARVDILQYKEIITPK